MRHPSSLTRAESAALLTLLLAGYLVLRGWPMIAAPQLWAEEGRLYLGSALMLGADEALTKAFNGYYQIFSNLTAVATVAWLDPVRYADGFRAVSGLVTVWALWIIVSARSGILPALADRFLVAAALLAFASNEVFLNTINLHFILPVAVWMLLGVDRLTPVQIVFVALAFLHGVTSLFLAPVFILRWVTRRDPCDLALSLIALACLAIQLSALFATHLGGARHFNLDQAPLVLTALYHNAAGSFLAELPIGDATVKAGLVIALYAGVVLRAAWTGAGDVIALALVPALLLLGLFTVSLPDMQGGGRYALVFSAIQTGLILWLCRGWLLLPARALIAVWLMVQILATFPPMQSEIGSWREELARSAAEGTPVVRIRPTEFWTVELK